MRPAELPEPFSSRPFTVREALDAGAATRARLRARDLAAPFHGARSREQPRTPFARASVYSPLLREGDYFSHSTAAAIWGIPLPARIERADYVHVSVDAPRFPPQGASVRGHRSFRPRTIVERSGLPVLTPEHTWCSLAVELDADELVTAGDHLVRRKRPLSSLERMSAAVERMRHALGYRHAFRALSRVRADTDSPAETRLRLLLVAAGLPEPRIRYTARAIDGSPIGTPDLAYSELRIAIEYEGVMHQEDRATYLSDIRRRELFRQNGWLVVLIVKEDIDLPIRAERLVREAIAERTATG